MHKWVGLFFCLQNFFAWAQEDTQNILHQYREQLTHIEQKYKGYSKDTALAFLYNDIAQTIVLESSDSVLFYYTLAHHYATKSANVRALAQCEITLGVYYCELGYYSRAIQHYHKALQILKNNYPLIQAEIYILLGISHLYTNQFDKALFYHNRSKNIYQKYKHQQGLIRNDANIGNTYLEAKQPEKALPIFKSLEKTLNSNPSIEDIPGYKCVNFINLSLTYLELGQITEAEVYKDSALVYCTLIRGIAEKHTLLNGWASYYLDQNIFQQAKEYLSESDSLAQMLNTDYTRLENAQLNYRLYKGLNNPTLALENLENYLTHYKKLNTSKAEAEVEYQTDLTTQKLEDLKMAKRHSDVLLWVVTSLLLSVLALYFFLSSRKLKRKNKQISEAMLRGQEIERKRVAIGLHDSIGAIVSSLKWSTEAINPKSLSEKDQHILQHVISGLEKVYNHIRLLSHNLIPEDLHKTGLWFTLKNMTEQLNLVSKIQFHIIKPDAQPEFSPQINFEIYNICLELVNNVIKHAKAQNVYIQIEMKNEAYILFTFEDDGTSTPSIGTSGRGFKNIQDRTDILNGKWTWEKGRYGGLKHQFIIPYKT